MENRAQKQQETVQRQMRQDLSTQMPSQSSAVNAPVMHTFNEQKSSTGKIVGLLVVLVILGIVTGFALSKYTATTGNVLPGVSQLTSSVDKGKTYGSNDTKTFKDTAEGVLRGGGIASEGQYHLVRPGGDSQNVYMTSSTVDLSQFIGKKIKVWGQTQQAQHAGWLMDVGRVEIE